jgi:DNA-binding IclR family transcriptional regulator
VIRQGGKKCKSLPGNAKAKAMKTVDNAMKLLSFFSAQAPEQKLSDLARAAGMDKASAMRSLGSLVACGLVEQDSETRHYRLGAGMRRLARIRNSTVPIAVELQHVLHDLTVQTNETSHVSVFSGQDMTTVAVCEPSRPTRVFVDPTQPLPVHATASGLVFLAHASDAVVDKVLAGMDVPMSFTATTISSPAELRLRLDGIRKRGFATATRTFDDEVTGIAAPIFDARGLIQATIAAACISSRTTEVLAGEIETFVLRACLSATRALGGTPPADFLHRIKENG